MTSSRAKRSRIRSRVSTNPMSFLYIKKKMRFRFKAKKKFISIFQIDGRAREGGERYTGIYKTQNKKKQKLFFFFTSTRPSDPTSTALAIILWSTRLLCNASEPPFRRSPLPLRIARADTLQT